jgi:hypothetical protein
VKRLVGFAHVARVAITIGEDGDGRQPHFTACPDDPDGDFAAVGDEDFHEAQSQAGIDRTARTGLGI